MRKLQGALQILLALTLITTWTPASGGPEDEEAFHLVSIVEVFPGTAADPSAQYVMMKAYFAGQNLVNGHRLYFFNSAGMKVDSANMPSNVANSANQMTILFATTSAATLFSVSRDFAMPAAINAAGGKICFDASNIDCISWGNYTGSPVGVGTAYRKGLGLELGKAAKRRHDIAGSPTNLDTGDDTQDSENDFNSGAPAPRNNAGGNGIIPPSTCGNNILESMEQCDDGNTTPNDGCNSACDDEYCGDGVVHTGEDCDDGNGVAGDGCALCLIEPECGNNIVEAGETCDDGNLVSGDGCDALCQLEPVCGNNIVEAGETCDDGNLVSGDGCDANCQIEPVCGNNIVEAGETCDDGNLISGDGCNSACQVETECGNLVVEIGEDCDDGNTTSGDGCDSLCQSEGCAVTLTGDVNLSGTLTSSDIIGLVNYVFKSGAPPQPCPASGDVNCSGTITSADVIRLVNFVFKGGPAPCDVCTIIPSMWSCP